MSQSNTLSPAIVAAEGTAFNAPASDRVFMHDTPATRAEASRKSEADELDFEQLSRLNSDFEDGLDVVRALESRCNDDGQLPPTFSSLLACALHKIAVGAIQCARRHPLATSLGVTAVGTVFGIALASRMTTPRLARDMRVH